MAKIYPDECAEYIVVRLTDEEAKELKIKPREIVEDEQT